MISLGHHITSPNDPLQKTPIEQLWRAIRSPKEDTAALVRQLRVVLNINPKQYAQLKRNLPYVVGAMFNPPYRRTENFAYTQHLILDLDHLSSKGLSPTDLRKRLEADPRVLLCFVSPSQDGLKLFFRLAERCYDSGLYSLAYRLFAAQFAKQYGIDQVLDQRTFDVTRACFVSHDPDAYYNPQAEPIDTKAFVDTEKEFNFFPLAHELEQKKAAEANSAEKEVRADVGDDIIANIKTILSPGARPRPEKIPAFVPQQLENSISDIVEHIQQTGAKVTEVVSIQYGKKIRTQVGGRMAETNVFYGKRGYSVVISPRTGTNAELNELVARLIKDFLNIP